MKSNASASEPLEAILRNVKGRRRREMIRDYCAAGKLDELCNELLNDSLDEEARRSLGQIHPTFMGAEYLPNYRRHEVEIARIELQSTTSDVISLRARGSGLRIKYRLVDEYQTEFGLAQQTSKRPFSLRELIVSWTPQNIMTETPIGFASGFPCGADLETLRDFTRVSSDFYPDLGFHYSRVIDEWYSAREELQSEGQQ